MPHSGQCLCGATKVRGPPSILLPCTAANPDVAQITVASTHAEQIICHCTDCQLTSGSHASTNILPLITDVKIVGNVKQYDAKALSGNTVSRLFCGGCGSALAHKTPAFGDAMAVQTGNLPDFRKVPVALELFVKDRWTGIPSVNGAGQAWTMPGTTAP
ncbi:hypothetical protein RQP46_005594 [Phenoliferia psychrophenolica]